MSCPEIGLPAVWRIGGMWLSSHRQNEIDMTLVIYVHGKGGSAAESEHYQPLFPNCEVIGVDYRSDTPWEAGPEIRAVVQDLSGSHECLVLK